MSSQPVESASQAILLDGSVASIRRLDASDFDQIVRLSETLTDRDRYLRFFTLHPAHLAAWARSLTERSDERYSLGAFDSGRLIGVANYVTCNAPGYAEVAIVVSHDDHLRGVGTALLRQLGLAAQHNGLHHFVADVLAENHLMLRLISDAGWRSTRHVDGSALHIEIDLENV